MLGSTRKVVVGLAGIAAAALSYAPGAEAGMFPMPVSDSSVAACVEEIGRHATYPEAGTIRHDVEVEQRRSIGHKLRISTTILSNESGADVRQYATVCTVVPNREPLRFTIREVGQ